MQELNSQRGKGACFRRGLIFGGKRYMYIYLTTPFLAPIMCVHWLLASKSSCSLGLCSIVIASYNVCLVMCQSSTDC